MLLQNNFIVRRKMKIDFSSRILKKENENSGAAVRKMKRKIPRLVEGRTNANWKIVSFKTLQ